MTAPLPRLATWLCLLAALFEGLTAGRALVLCVEPGGSASLEASLGGSDCDGCTEAPVPVAPDGSCAALEEPAQPRCACVDVTLDLAANGVRTRPADVRAGFAQPALLPVAPPAAVACGGLPSACDGRWSGSRPGTGAALVGSVVLVV